MIQQATGWAPPSAQRSEIRHLVGSHMLDAALVVLLVLLVAGAFLPFTVAGFVGTDTLTLIDTSRVSSWTDVVNLLRGPVMAGTTFTGDELIYRPLVSLSFAADYAVWGLNPLGYHITNTVLHGLTVLSIFALARHAGLGAWAALASGALFALSPIATTTIPVLARRDTVFSAAFFWVSMAVLAFSMRPERSRAVTRGGVAISLILFAGALLAKEMAYVGALVAPGVAFATWTAWADPRRKALAAYLRLVAPYAAVTLAAFLVRYLVLGGLGGYSATELTPDVHEYVRMLEQHVRFLLWPIYRDVWTIPATIAGALASLLLTAGAIWVMPPRYRAIIAVGASWVVLFGVLYMVLRTYSGAWYAYFPLVGLVLVIGCAVDFVLHALRQRAQGAYGWSWRNRSRHWAGRTAMVVGCAVYGIATLVQWPFAIGFPVWQQAGNVWDRYSSETVACLQETDDGATVIFHALPDQFKLGADVSALLVPTLFSDYTLQSIVHLMLPGRSYNIQVESTRVADRIPATGPLATCQGDAQRRVIDLTWV